GICIGGHDDLLAAATGFPIAVIALPSGAEKLLVRMGIDRYPHGFAPLIELDVSAIAFPAATGRIQIRIRRNFDGNAGLFGPSKPSRALPAASERARVSVDRRYRSERLGRDAGGCSEQRCRERQARQQ